MEIKTEDPKLILLPPDKLLLWLKEQDGPRRLIIELNPVSFNLLMWKFKRMEMPSPDMFDFILTCMDSLKACIEKAVIYDLVDRHYYSRIVLKDERENRTYNLELHIPYAMGVAFAAKCPIFVAEEVFEKTAALEEEDNRNIDDDKMKKMLKDMDPKKYSKN